MNDNSRRIILVFIVLAAFIAAFWYFTDIFVYIFAAIILSILGNPLMKFLLRAKVKGKSMPQSLAAAISLIVILGVLGGLSYWIVPLVIREIQQLANIDTSMVVSGLQTELGRADAYLKQQNLLPDDVSLSTIVIAQVQGVLAEINISSIFGGVINFATGLFIFVFSVIFMTFFALKDNHIFWKMLKKMIPTSLRTNFDNILVATKSQLVRYFTGVFSEMLLVGTFVGLICYFLGVPSALLIGFVAGMLNIIPYVGPLIAVAISIVVGITSMMASAIPISLISVVIIKIICTFIFVKLLDDFVLQPTIYGKSISAHPLEIFIVILLAGEIGGIWGMMFAVPAYTLVRIIAKEFFSQYFAEIDEKQA